MAGGSDDAQAKERWFMQKFGVDAIFTPSKPVFSALAAASRRPTRRSPK